MGAEVPGGWWSTWLSKRQQDKWESSPGANASTPPPPHSHCLQETPVTDRAGQHHLSVLRFCVATKLESYFGVKSGWQGLEVLKEN